MDFTPASKVAPAKPSPPRPCEVCGESFARRFNQSRSNFERKRTCGKRACKSELARRNLVAGGGPKPAAATADPGAPVVLPLAPASVLLRIGLHTPAAVQPGPRERDLTPAAAAARYLAEWKARRLPAFLTGPSYVTATVHYARMEAS
jgi:hypothetical protein